MILPSIRFLGLVAPGDTRWEEALDKVPHDFFHLSAYLKACALHEHGEAQLFLLDAGSHGMLVPFLKRPLGAFGSAFQDYSDASSPYGYPCPLYWGDGCEELLPEMHRHFDTFMGEQKIVSIFLRLNPFLGASVDVLAGLGETLTHGPTTFIDLRDEHASWMEINSSNRQFITRTLAMGCTLRFDDWEAMDPSIEAYTQTMARLGAVDYYYFPKAFFHTLHEKQPEHFHLVTCYEPMGQLAGGAFFTEVGGLIQYFLTGTFTQFTPLSPAKLMINAMRLWGVERGHHTLHLGGGLGAQKDNLYEFKERLSRGRTTFSTFRKVLLPEVYSALSQGRELDGDHYFPAYRRPELVS